MFARVIKDLIADTHPEGLLNHIIQNDRKSSLGFYVSFIRPFTREFFPEMRPAFKEFKETENWDIVEEARRKGYDRARQNALALMELHASRRNHSIEWVKDQIFSKLIEPLGILRGSKDRHGEG